jgi:GT2 family glycosyltransferase
MPSQKEHAWIRNLSNRVPSKVAQNVEKHFARVIELAKRSAPPIEQAQLANGPFISFVATLRDTPANHLQDLFESVVAQPDGSAELILSDDASTQPQTLAWLNAHDREPCIRLLRNRRQGGIAAATNAAIESARGTWIGFINPDDTLTPYVVQLIAQAAKEHPQAQLIYTDEVLGDEKLTPVSYICKPAFDEVMLSGGNYIAHLACYRRDRVLAIGGLRAGYDCAEEYDLLLRYARDVRHDEILHLPYPGYRRRATRSSPLAVTQTAESSCKALAERYRSDEGDAQIDDAMTKGLFRVRFDAARRRWPRVSVVIPNRNSLPLISRVLTDLSHRTNYGDLEIIVVDNGTTNPKVIDLYARMKQGKLPFECIFEPGAFNFSHQVNRGIAAATGQLVLLLNNDIEVIDPDWLRELVSCFDYPGVGIVGARLLYPDRRLQHAGTIIGLRNGLAAHWFVGRPDDYPGPMARLHVRQSLSAVTGACMLISRACIEAVGKFNETNFPVAYNDVDVCLRAVAKGFRIIWTPFATLIHRESMSRGRDTWRPDKVARLRRERAALRRCHHTDNFDDRAFSPWYSRRRLEPAIVLLDRLPKAR